MLRIAVCDDLPEHCDIAKEKITDCLSPRKISFSIDTFFSGSDLLSSGTVYDLLFMDIALGNEDGMDVAKTYSQGKRTRIILLTSHKEEMPNGYKIGAFRFLTKPIDEEALKEALDSAIELVGREQWLPCYDTDKREYHIYSSEIFYIEAFHRKCVVCTKDSSYNCFLGIRQIADLLCSPDFFQTHRSYIVNLRHIRCFGQQELELMNRARIPVSRPNVTDCFRKYQTYIRSDHYGNEDDK